MKKVIYFTWINFIITRLMGWIPLTGLITTVAWCGSVFNSTPLYIAAGIIAGGALTFLGYDIRDYRNSRDMERRDLLKNV